MKTRIRWRLPRYWKSHRPPLSVVDADWSSVVFRIGDESRFRRLFFTRVPPEVNWNLIENESVRWRLLGFQSQSLNELK